MQLKIHRSQIYIYIEHQQNMLKLLKLVKSQLK